jgi:hypothetical protein
MFRPRGCRRPKRHPEATHALAESVRQAVARAPPAGLAFAITLKTDEPATFLSERVEPHPEAR